MFKKTLCSTVFFLLCLQSAVAQKRVPTQGLSCQVLGDIGEKMTLEFHLDDIKLLPRDFILDDGQAEYKLKGEAAHTDLTILEDDQIVYQAKAENLYAHVIGRNEIIMGSRLDAEYPYEGEARVQFRYNAAAEKGIVSFNGDLYDIGACSLK
jgi:hypothetical protein